MNSSTLLVILAVVVVCAVVFVLFSRSGKNKAAEKKADPAEANKYALVAQDILKGIGGKDNVVLPATALPACALWSRTTIRSMSRP